MNNNNELEETEGKEVLSPKADQKETGINRQFFEEVIENSTLSPEDKKKIGEFKDFKNDTVGEVLKVEDKPKLAAYEKLAVKDLPEDWRAQLARLKELERKTFDYNQKTAELKGWTDTFGEKNPEKVKEVINLLEEKNKEIGEELITEKEQHNSTKTKLTEWEQAFSGQTPLKLQEKITELEAKVKEWTNFFENRELAEIKTEIAELRKRPELSISEKQFWDDYAQRKSVEQSELEKEELIQSRKKIVELEKNNQKMYNSIARFLENRRIQRYALANPVLNEKDAQKEIAELLEVKEKEWSDYLENGNTTTVSPELILNCQEFEKAQQAHQVLEYIKEARATLDYQKLFERWSGGTKYNKENDLDGGSLYLLWKRLEVLNENNQITEQEVVFLKMVEFHDIYRNFSCFASFQSSLIQIVKTYYFGLACKLRG